jgi:hypothetical protein
METDLRHAPSTEVVPLSKPIAEELALSGKA